MNTFKKWYIDGNLKELRGKFSKLDRIREFSLNTTRIANKLNIHPAHHAMYDYPLVKEFAKRLGRK